MKFDLILIVMLCSSLKRKKKKNLCINENFQFQYLHVSRKLETM